MKPLTSIESIARDFVEELLDSSDEKVHLAGVCWGAAVAFEMASQLRSRGRPAASLALLDPGTLLRKTGPAWPLPLLRFVRRRLAKSWKEFRATSWPERGRWLVQKVGRVTARLGSSEALDDTRRELDRFGVREANRTAIERYRPGTLECPARVFITADRTLRDRTDPRLEWLTLIEPRPEVLEIPGFDSGDAMAEHTSDFAAAVDAWLAEIEGPGPAR